MTNKDIPHAVHISDINDYLWLARPGHIAIMKEVSTIQLLKFKDEHPQTDYEIYTTKEYIKMLEEHKVLFKLHKDEKYA